MDPPVDCLVRAEDAALDLLATTALCGATSVFARLWADLGAVAPRLAFASANISIANPRLAVAQLVTAARRPDARLFVTQMELAPHFVARDGCGIDALGPLLWRLLHTVAQLNTHIDVAGRSVRPIAYLLLVFPEYFPPRCPCRANYVARLPRLRNFLRNNPQLDPELALRLTIELHASVNRQLKRPPYAHHMSAENAMIFWKGQCA